MPKSRGRGRTARARRQEHGRTRQETVRATSAAERPRLSPQWQPVLRAYLNFQATRALVIGALAVIVAGWVLIFQPQLVGTGEAYRIGLASTGFWFAVGWLLGTIYLRFYVRQTRRRPAAFLELAQAYADRRAGSLRESFRGDLRRNWRFFGLDLGAIYVITLIGPTAIAFTFPTPSAVAPVAGHLLAQGVWLLLRERDLILQRLAR